MDWWKSSNRKTSKEAVQLSKQELEVISSRKLTDREPREKWMNLTDGLIRTW